MRQDYSFGIIPLRQQQDEWQVLLVQHQAGHWAFPKGHADPGERPIETAERELYEETGLKVQAVLSDQTLFEHYFFTIDKKRVHKTVEYFMALVSGSLSIQEKEIQAACWLPLYQAAEVMTFPAGKNLCLQVQDVLRQN